MSQATGHSPQCETLFPLPEPVFTCACCGEDDISEDDVITGPDDETYCETCYDETFATCGRCDDIILQDDVITINANTRSEIQVCESCRDNYYIECTGCGDHFDSDHIYMSDSSDSYCESCSEDMTYCDDCGEVISCESSYYDENDSTYCEYCYYHNEHDENGRDIHDYGYKPEPVFYGLSHSHSTAGILLMGSEVEIDCGRDRDDCAADIVACGEEIYLKDDGSLSGSGLEIVSHPCTLEYHRARLDWARIMGAARDHGYRSHNTETCGIHVHVNRDYFGDHENLQDFGIAKVLLLVDRFWAPLVTFSRRRDAQLKHWAPQVELDIESSDGPDIIVDKTKATAYRGRYQAVNLTNEHTIEFRIFRGTLNLQTFTAILELVDTLCRFARDHTLQDVQSTSWARFRTACTAAALCDYLTSKNL
jgi:hypothetical protein